MRSNLVLLVAFVLSGTSLLAQSGGEDARAIAHRQLVQLGFAEEDLGELVVKDDYTSGGIQHVILRQKWQGIEVWNGDIAVHQRSDGGLIAFNHAAEPRLAKRVNSTTPQVSAQTALSNVLAITLPGVAIPAEISSADQGRIVHFDGSALGEQAVEVKLYLLPMGDALRLVWNVNHYTPDGYIGGTCASMP